jgi:hypothetical protein
MMGFATENHKTSHDSRRQMIEEETQWLLSKDGWHCENLAVANGPYGSRSLPVHLQDELAGQRCNC